MLCHYEDRMSMEMSREIRLPFLESRLIDLMVRAPDKYKIQQGWTKYAFRKAVEPILPKSITWRRDKKGFSNPESEWLKKELESIVLTAFSKNGQLARLGIIKSPAMLQRYKVYQRQKINAGNIWSREIFAPLSLEIWLQKFMNWIN